MPAYRVERFIAEAIASVQAQTMADWELLVIDDCSPDGSCGIARRMANGDSRIKVLKNKVNQGVAATRNRGIDLARGTYIAFLDSDDRWHPKKLEQQLRKAESCRAGIVYCSYAIIDAEGNKCRADYLVPERVGLGSLLKENCIQCSAMLIRADILKHIRFNTEFYHEDYVLGLDILGAGHTAAGCGEVLLDWRYLENSRSFNKKKSARNRWRIYRDYLKLPLGRRMYLFSCYTLSGLRKYLAKA